MNKNDKYLFVDLVCASVTANKEDPIKYAIELFEACNGMYSFPKEETEEKFDFSKVYDLYPRKIGKSLGLRRLKSKVKTSQEFEQLMQAVSNYKKHCQNYEDQKYIKHFSSWVSDWKDWIAPSVKRKTFQEVL